MILVTGATGCLGGHVVADLQRSGHRVRVLIEPGTAPAAGADWSAGPDVVTGDVLDAAAVDRAMTGCGQVIHLAALAGVLVRSPDLMSMVNVQGTRNVAQAARRHGARMVHVSSASAVGLVRDRLIDETHQQCELPAHPYPRSKRAGEQAVVQEAARGLSAVILNPGAVLATGGSVANTWSGLVVAVARGLFPVSPAGGFGFVSRASLMHAVTASLAGAGGTSAERYLLVDANLSHHTLITEIAHRIGVRAPWAVCPPRLLESLAGLGGLAAQIPGLAGSVLLRPANLPFLNWTVTYDSTRSRRELGVIRRPIAEALDELTSRRTA